MVLKAALSLRYRRRSPDALANVILGLLLVAVCLVSWELVVPASAPSLGAAPAGGRLLLQAPPVSSSSDSGAFQPPPPPAPKQPKQFNGLDKARARACGRSRAAMSPWPQGLSGTHFCLLRATPPLLAPRALPLLLPLERQLALRNQPRTMERKLTPKSPCSCAALSFSSSSTLAASSTASSASPSCARSTSSRRCSSWARSSTSRTT